MYQVHQATAKPFDLLLGNPLHRNDDFVTHAAAGFFAPTTRW
jgi:hypothetical protein